MSKFVELPLRLYPVDAFSGFDPRPEFSLPNARTSMWMSQVAYETRSTEPKLPALQQKWGLRALEPFHGTRNGADTRGVIAETDDAVFLSFAGTDPAVLQNVITDLRAVRVASEIHPGFRDAFGAASLFVDEAIRKSSGKGLFIVGHSLGAALAVLATRHARQAAAPVTATYLFGCPRVGNADFRAAYDALAGATSYRLVHGKDIVARIPGITAYRHVGRLVGCPTRGRFAVPDLESAPGGDEPRLAHDELDVSLDKVLERLRLPDRLPWGEPLTLLLGLLPEEIRDHLPDRYCEALPLARD